MLAALVFARVVFSSSWAAAAAGTLIAAAVFTKQSSIVVGLPVLAVRDPG